MTVQELITSIDSKVPNSFTSQDKVDFINELEQSIYYDIVKKFVSNKIGLTADVSSYDYPTGVTFEDIEAVLLNDNELKKLVIRQKFKHGYFDDGGKLALYPTPSMTDDVESPSLEVISRFRPTKKLIGNIATDTLVLPDVYADIYRYYIYSQIAYLRENFAVGDNWARKYNARIGDFTIWYDNHRPKEYLKQKSRW
jgi:hypothetical protein